MNRFQQHIPTYVEVTTPPPILEFETTKDLLNLEVVKRYVDEGFHLCMHTYHLMVTSDDGFYWWVVGYIEDPESIDLPPWEGWKYHAILPSGEEKILKGDEIVSSCEEIFTLKDGTLAMNLRYKK